MGNVERLENVNVTDDTSYWRCTDCGTRWRESHAVAAFFAWEPPCPKCDPELRSDAQRPIGTARMVDVKDITPQNRISIELHGIIGRMGVQGRIKRAVLEACVMEIDRLHAENCLLKLQTAERMQAALERMGFTPDALAQSGAPCCEP